MIIRHLQINDPSKEDLHRLIEYQEHGKDHLQREERVLYTGTGNCIGEDAFAAEAEMKILALANKRVKKSEHFAHLIFSPSPEDPALSHEQWKEIINRTLKSLHMSDHQYFYYVHKDTDQEHMHLVINRINPDTLKWNDMSYDFRVFQELGTEFENQYGLKKVAHEKKYTKEQSQALDLERKSGQQSFFYYVYSFRDELLSAQSWEDFHRVCSLHNIKAEKKGRGMVFSTEFEDKTVAVKASGIDRDLSLVKLTERFGLFSDQKTEHKSEDSYNAKPVGYSAEKDKVKNVYEEYRQLQDNNRKKRKLLLAQEAAHFKEEKRKLMLTFKDMQKTAYFEYKNNPQALKQEKERISEIKKQMIKELEAQHNKKVSSIRKQTRTMRFQDYLRDHDLVDNDLSRDLLQSRAGSQNSQGLNQINGEELNNNLTITKTLFFKVIKRTTKGTDIFSSAISRGDSIRDNGRTLTLNRKPSLVTVADAMNLALERFGDKKPLKINGSLNFQRQCALIAVQNNISIEVSDPKINEYYQKLQEKVNDRRGNYRSVSDGSEYRRERSIRRAAAEYRARRRAAFRTARRGSGNSSEDFSSIITFSEAGNIHRVRTFFPGAGRSQSQGTDSVTSADQGSFRRTGNAAKREYVSDMFPRNMAGDQQQRTEQTGMLLHGNDVKKLDESKSKGNSNKLRQGLSDARRQVDSRNVQPQQDINDQAAIRYMNERNGKRKTISDILEHRIWTPDLTGNFKFSGFRNLDKKPYILLKKDNIIYIKVTSNYEKRRLHNAGLNSDVEVRADGKVMLSTRERTENIERGRK